MSVEDTFRWMERTLQFNGLEKAKREEMGMVGRSHQEVLLIKQY